MKKMKMKLIPVIGLLAALTIITSCGKDDEPVAAAPSVSISATVDGDALANGGDVTVGSAVSLAVTVTAPGGVNGLTVTSGTQVTSYNRSELGAESGDTSGELVLNISAPTEADIDGTASFEFEAVDDLGQTSSVLTFTYTIIAAPSPDAMTYGTTMITPPDGDGTTDTFFGIGNNTLYSHNDVIGTSDPVSSDIDLGYYYGASNNASLSSPAAYPSAVFDISAWGTRKNTQVEMTTLTMEDWEGLVTVEDVNTQLASITFSNNIQTNLSVGDILAFQTDDTEAISGFIYVEAINGTDGISDNISVQFVLNQEAE